MGRWQTGRYPGFGGRFSWALYDWANSSFAAVISTFVFPVYFASQVAGDEVRGTALWGNTVGIAGLVVALGAPVVGAVADRYGRRKPWLALCTLFCVLATGALWWVKPDSAWLPLAILLAGAATVAAEYAVVFYNAMLPGLAPAGRLGRWSGWAWALGYAGGLACLLLALFGFVNEGAWWPLPRDEDAHVRATFPLVALWYGLFSLPLFLFAPDEPATATSLRRAVGEGLSQLAQSLRRVRRYRGLMRFLLARLLFIDGLATIFAFGGVYAAGTFGFGPEQVLYFGIALNVSAGVGAALFAWLDDYFGSKQAIQMALVGLVVTAALLLIITSTTLFWVLGVILGLFVGPVQAASRSYLAGAAPVALRNQLFGLFAFSGKATAFAGPLLVAWITSLFASQRAGMSVILAFLLAGLALLYRLPSATALRQELEAEQA